MRSCYILCRKNISVTLQSAWFFQKTDDTHDGIWEHFLIAAGGHFWAKNIPYSKQQSELNDKLVSIVNNLAG